MTFLQPFILWGLPLLFIPIIIHLLNRLRHRPQPWAAMRFLRAANQSSINQAKLRQILVLLFRVLAVVALIFFLSRPLAGGWLGWALSPAPEVVLLILDRSASMETQTAPGGLSRREQAIALWTEALRSFGQSSRIVLLDNVHPAPQELPALSALEQPGFSGPSDARTDMPALLQRAYNYLSETRPGGAEVWIASDLQESNWLPQDGQWERIVAQFSALPQKVRFRLLAFEQGGLKNTSISLVEAVRQSQGQQRSLSVIVDVRQNQPAESRLLLRWSLAGAASQAELSLTGESLRWRNQFPLPASNEPGWGSIETDADANAADNKLFFAFDVERPPGALVVTTDGPSARPVQLAASDLNKPAAEWARALTPEQFMGAGLSNTALIVWQWPVPPAATDFLEQFVQSGGSLLFLPDGVSTQSFAGLSFGEVTTARSNAVFAVTKWDELDGPLARTQEGYFVPVRDLEIYRRARIHGTGGVLATFADEAPFLVRKAIGKGEVYFCATSAAPGWSSLADGAVLVPMLRRMVAAGAKRVNSVVMTDCTELAGTEVSGWERVDKRERSDPRLEAGVYQVGGRFVAVNRPSAENELHGISAETVRQLFRGLSFQMHQEQGRGSDRLQGEVWRLFLTLMLLFLIVEGILILPPKAEGGAAKTRARAAVPELAEAR